MWSTVGFLLLTCKLVLAGEIVQQPEDKIVLENQAINLTCTTDFRPYKCQWLIYRNNDASRMSEVQRFNPVRDKDCSITIKQLRPVHVGRWVCRVQTDWWGGQVTSHAAKVTLAVPTPPPPPPAPSHQHQRLSDRPLNVTVVLGEPLTLDCRAEKEVTRCGWLTPGGKFIDFDASTSTGRVDSDGTLFSGNLSTGDCRIRLDNLRTNQLGAWSCLLEVDGSAIWTAPAYLSATYNEVPRTARMLDDNGPPAALTRESSSTLLVATSIVAVAAACVVMALVVMRRRRARRSEEDDTMEDSEGGMTIRIRNMQRQQKEEESKKTVVKVLDVNNVAVCVRAEPNEYVTRAEAVIDGAVYDELGERGGAPAWTLSLDGLNNGEENIYAEIDHKSKR